MSWYTTPLQFGYFLSLLLALVFFFRGLKAQRLSDKLLGFFMLILALELQDYTFGFSGINYLWNELNGFPRGVNLLFGPSLYFYLRSQTNREFKFKTKHLWHYLPWTALWLWHLLIFIQGKTAVDSYQNSDFSQVFWYVAETIKTASYAYYFYLCFKLYHQYRVWAVEYFTNSEKVNFLWLRNFLYLMIFWVSCKFILGAIDLIFNLPFYQDWWWNLALVAAATYVGLHGLAQAQEKDMSFKPIVESTPLAKSSKTQETVTEQKNLAKKLNYLMAKEALYLQPDLNLKTLAQHLNTNTALLSATVNQQLGKNFNDYINSLRINEFIARYALPKNSQYTLLAIAYDCGFNSKATFNRAFKKEKGQSPKEFLLSQA